MRYSLFLLLLLALPLVAAQDEEKKTPQEPPRYGFEYNPVLYPQKTPKDAMASVIKAIDNKRVDYMLAQLAEPTFVDRQVDDFKPQFPNARDDAQKFLAFDKLVAETVHYFDSDPILVKQLRKFAHDAEWDVNEDAATGTVKDLPARKVFMKKIGERWFMENKQQ